MSDQESPEDPPTISAKEQREIAVDWFFAMWNEALKRGVAGDTLSAVALSATLGELVRRYGEEGVATLVESLPGQIRAGAFTVKQ